MKSAIDVEVNGIRLNPKLDSVQVRFGPHHYVFVNGENGKIEFGLGATPHGFEADASTVGGTLETIIDEVRAKHPELARD